MLKKFFFIAFAIVCLSFLFSTNLYAKKFTWSQSPTPSVSGYKIYYGTSPGTYTSNIDIGNITEYQVENLPLTSGTRYYLIVKAYNRWKESPASNELIYIAGDTTPPTSPTNVRIVNFFSSLRFFC